MHAFFLLDHSRLLVRKPLAEIWAPDERVVEALIGLSSDPDRKVREWATFGLGSLSGLDTSQIREALWARVSDEDAAVRGEALIGLAERRDARVLEPLSREISGEFHGTW